MIGLSMSIHTYLIESPVRKCTYHMSMQRLGSKLHIENKDWICYVIIRYLYILDVSMSHIQGQNNITIKTIGDISFTTVCNLKF